MLCKMVYVITFLYLSLYLFHIVIFFFFHFKPICYFTVCLIAGLHYQKTIWSKQ